MFASVATAVTKGDLTQSIAVEAQGEVAILEQHQQMIANLGDNPEIPRARLAEN